jgi:hypothetical protein
MLSGSQISAAAAAILAAAIAVPAQAELEAGSTYKIGWAADLSN